MKIIQACAIALLSHACAVQPGPVSKSAAPTGPTADTSTVECNFAALDGRPFAFRPAAPDVQPQMYTAWQLSLEPLTSKPDYAETKGLFGKLQDEVVNAGPRGDYFVAQLEDCSMLYAMRRSREETPFELEERGDIYFLETYAQVEAQIGKTFWLKRWPGTGRSRRLVTTDPTISYPWRTFDAVRLVGIEPTVLDHADGDGPLLVEVELANGARALAPWSKAYLTTEDPINPSWNLETVTAIQQGRISVGMPADAVRASWGDPVQIIRRPAATIVMEQWVYRNGYAYIRNGHLQSTSGVR